MQLRIKVPGLFRRREESERQLLEGKGRKGVREKECSARGWEQVMHVVIPTGRRGRGWGKMGKKHRCGSSLDPGACGLAAKSLWPQMRKMSG